MVDWNYDKETKTLTISGTGEMEKYSNFTPTPWARFNIKKVIIEDGVTSIGSGAFSGRRSLTSVTIPKSVITIGYSAFSGCSSLISVTIPDSVASIGDCAFDSCESLTSVTIPDSVTSIGWGSFKDCNGLTYVTIPDSVTKIGIKAFSGCKNLTSVTIFNGVTSIGKYAFSNCPSLTSVTLPDNITYVENIFEGCEKLKSITLQNNNRNNQILLHYCKDEPFSKQIEMVISKDYTVKMKREVKYGLLWQLFRVKPDEEELTAYIKKNFSRMMHFAIDHNDTEAINKVCENEKLLTSKNIDDLIDYTINNTQNGGSLEIQATLMNYKNEHFGDKKKRLRL